MNDSESRRQILAALRAARRPFSNAAPPSELRPVVPRTAYDVRSLVDQFAQQAAAQGAQVYRAVGGEQALEMLLTQLQGQRRIAAWEPSRIGLPGLDEALREAEIELAHAYDAATVEVGLTGAMAGLAATGSLALSSGTDAYRNSSLLPPTHIAVLHEHQLMPDLESWFAAQRRDGFRRLRQASNVVFITGPSRTADIAMELVMGMHGPRELHILLVADGPTAK